MTGQAETAAVGRPIALGAAVTAMVLSAACWGFATVMSKGALSAFPPPVLVCLQLGASVAFLWSAVGITGQGIRFDRATRLAGLSGVLEPGLAYVFGTFGLLLTTAGNASLIATTEPLLIAVLAWLLFREKVRPATVAAILAAMAGVAMVTGAHGAGSGQSPLGDVLVILGTLFAALYVVASSRLVAKIEPLALAALQQTVGLVFAVAFLLAWSPEAIAADLGKADAGMLALALVSGIVQYALAFWLYLVGLKRLAASTAALFLTLTPVFGIGGAALFLGEEVTPWQAAGTLIILASVAVASQAARK
ncbi:DMT family transporter [Ensifer adhaerens]|uniref:DMT family transporter n=1 Tax=Ensifer adhaerens TaxID=106592 RepID=UPI00098F3461|nr:DMT family transporter [Ensifer adhaerens]